MSLSLDLDDTIAAIASAPGGALRGIVRISGPEIRSIVARVFTADQSPPNDLNRAVLLRGQLALPRDLPPCPATLYLWPNQRSYTRQPSAELHLPGSPPILEAALEAICQAGARLARPGEFTLRAFLAGRLDLTQAEAVLGVIDARSQSELDASLAQLAGGLAQPLHALRERLLAVLAHLEAGLDFADEDIEFITAGELDLELAGLHREIDAIAQQMSARSESSRLPRVVFVGLPNAGKSSLFNALAGNQAAIVSPEAGTTRDYVACRVNWHGAECLLIDTAGAADDSNIAEPLAAAAQSAMREQLEQADLILHCFDSARTPADRSHELPSSADEKPTLVVGTKGDLPGWSDSGMNPADVLTSAHTGLGINELRRTIAGKFETIPAETSAVAGTAERCRDSLRLAAEALARARDATQAGLGEELVAAELRTALDEIGLVVGAVYTDDILDQIFSRFCIGK